MTTPVVLEPDLSGKGKLPLAIVLPSRDRVVTILMGRLTEEETETPTSGRWIGKQRSCSPSKGILAILTFITEKEISNRGSPVSATIGRTSERQYSFSKESLRSKSNLGCSLLAAIEG